MAISTGVSLSRNSAIALSALSTDTAGSTGIFARTTEWGLAAVSTLASTMTTADANLYVKLDRDEKIGFIVSWNSTVGAPGSTGVNLRFRAGDYWRSDLGDLTLQLCTAGTTGPKSRKWFVGPLEGSRFARRATSSGFGVNIGESYIHLDLTLGANSTIISTGGVLTGASSGRSHSCQILEFRFPTVEYAT